MKIRVYQSGSGDCLLLTGDGAKPARVLIDGGKKAAFDEHVAADLAKLKRPLDIVNVSHIDADHIEGVLKMMDDIVAWRVYDFQKQSRNLRAKPPKIPRPPGVRKIWHNAFHDTVPRNTAAITDMLAASSVLLTSSTQSNFAHFAADYQNLVQGEKQAIQLSRRVGPDQLGIPVNPEFKHKLMLLNPKKPRTFKVSGMKFKLLGPTEADLAKLRKEWNLWLEVNQKVIREIQNKARVDANRLGQSVDALLAPMTAGADELLNSQLAFMKTLGRRSKVTTPNLASIMFHVEGGGRSCLLTGDGHSEDVIKGLEAHGLLDANKRLHVNIIKVPHHGAEHNIDRAFCHDITADDYIFCGNGHSENPEIDVIKVLAQERRAALPEKPFRFWFNCDPKTGHGAHAAHMKKVAKEAKVLVAASKGKLQASFIKGSFFDV